MKSFPSPTSRRAFLAAGAAVAASCSSGGTGGYRVALASRIVPGPLTFTNAFGFTVHVERALLSVGALRYLEGAPVARSGGSRRGLALLRRVFGVRAAQAHPGHYVAGGVLGEMLTPTSVDLALGQIELAGGPGVTGTALSGRFTFGAPPAGPFAGALSPHVVWVEGDAEAAGVVRRFRAVADVEDVLDAEGAPEVLGCELRDGEIDGDGAVALTVSPAIWFDQVDFAAVPASTDGTAVELARELTPHKAFARGLKKAAAYAFAYARERRIDG